MKSLPFHFALLLVTASIGFPQAAPASGTPTTLQPRVVTSPTRHDTDDPAIWVNRANPAASLIIGTDKDADGALYVYDLAGKIVADKVVRGLARPNNVDIAYEVSLGGEKVDLAIVAERYAHRLRVYQLPDMAPVDRGGIPVFEGEAARDCMGIALYTRSSDGALFAIVSRSDYQSPRQGYLHQYRLIDDGAGTLRGVFVRSFGDWSGEGEIESIAVDNELGYVYFSDEAYGVRKYHADPMADDGDEQLAELGRTGFAKDREGISIYKVTADTGYLLVSDQGANQFQIFTREGEPGNPHAHKLLKTVKVAAMDSDGSEVTNMALGPAFPHGLFVAMSTDKTFHFYSWDDIAGADLKKASGNASPAR